MINRIPFNYILKGSVSGSTRKRGMARPMPCQVTSYRKCAVTSKRYIRLTWKFGKQETIRKPRRYFLRGFFGIIKLHLDSNYYT